MKLLRFINAAAAMLVMAAVSAGCGDSKDEPVPPVEPDQPVLGPEVSQNVIYQANPRFFASDECFKAVTARIPAIADMGCDMLWIMPVNTPGELKAFGSPYCIRDFRGINPRYGTATDFKALVDAAHKAGMKVVLDWIANHTAWDHEWITAHPEYYRKDAAGNIAQASTWTDVAQLDYSNAGTVKAMTDDMLYWVNEMGVDGFRCDYAEGVPHDFWKQAIDKFRAIRPDFFMLAETSQESFYKDGFDMIYDWNYAPAVAAAFTGGKASDIFTREADSWSKVPEGASILRYVFNHDVAAENDYARYYGSADAQPAAYVAAAMLHGTPMIYSSMDADVNGGKLSFFDYKPLAFSAEKAAVYKAINKAYKASAELRRAELRTYPDKDVLSFTRTAGDHTLLVMVNTPADARTVKTPIALTGLRMTDMINGGETAVPVTIQLPAYGYIIYMN